MDAIHNAAEYGRLGEVQKIVSENPDAINLRDRLGNQPLHTATHAGRIKVATFLLESGADINAIGVHGRTPLHSAVNVSNDRLVSLFLERGCDPYLKNKSNRTAFYFAAQAHDEKCIAAFLHHGVNPDIFTLLQLHRVGEVVRMIQDNPKLLKSLAHPEDVISDAIDVDAVEVVKLVLNAGVDPNAHHFNGSGPPIVQAVHKGRLKIIRLLLDAGAKTNVCDHADRPLLEVAKRSHSSPTVVRLLKEHGAK